MKVFDVMRLGAIGVLLSSPAWADGHLNQMGPDELLPLAEAEEEVVVYSFTSRIWRVEAAFEEAYPNIDLQGFDISSTEQIARLKAEAQAGVTNADVIYISDTPVVLTELLAAGIIAPYVPPRVADRVPAEYQSPLLAQRLSTTVLMYNEEGEVIAGKGKSAARSG